MRNRTILNGDAAQKLIEIEDNSIDEIVTDPPYGYSFMNKDWDKVVIGSSVWVECLRVLKPGSFAFVMSAPRQDVLCRIMINLDQAGFNIGFTSIYWAYASGFPKAMNVSKAVDKKLGVERDVIGKRDDGVGKISESGIYELNNPDSKMSKEIEITKPPSPQAIKLDGAYAGFQPKPALEVILVCMKPLDQKNYVEQALSNGHGVTWLDDCRIPYKNENDRAGWYDTKNEFGFAKFTGGDGGVPYKPVLDQSKGRFPANLLVSDNALDVGKKTKSKAREKNFEDGNQNTPTHFKHNEKSGFSYDDEGDFSRYYSLDSWEAQFIITPKPSKSEKNDGLDKFTGKQVNDGRNIPPDNAFQRGKTVRQNIHPTVKPVELFKYLISMGSRPDDFILDPFMGSGTTAIACEKLARNWIGIEINDEYCEIIRARIDDYRKQMRLF